MSPKYDIPVPIVTDLGSHRNSLATLLRRESHSTYKSDDQWKGIQPQPERQEIQLTTTSTSSTSHQDAAVLTPSERTKEKQLIAIVPEHFSEKSTMSTHADSGHGRTVCSAGHYEELPGRYTTQQSEKFLSAEKVSFPRIFNRPKNPPNTTICSSYQPSAGHNTSSSNDVIDLKSMITDRNNPNLASPPWILPTKNSFTSYAKPLPRRPKAAPTKGSL
ncbi:protocadherin beta-12-like isoform X1 [Argonauta hians]